MMFLVRVFDQKCAKISLRSELMLAGLFGLVSSTLVVFNRCNELIGNNDPMERKGTKRKTTGRESIWISRRRIFLPGVDPWHGNEERRVA